MKDPNPRPRLAAEERPIQHKADFGYPTRIEPADPAYQNLLAHRRKLQQANREALTERDRHLHEMQHKYPQLSSLKASEIRRMDQKSLVDLGLASDDAIDIVDTFATQQRTQRELRKR